MSEPRRRHRHYVEPPTSPPSLFPLAPAFKGTSFSEPLDQERLETALAKVKRALESGRAWTLAELAAEAHCSEAGASARIRDCRKMYGLRIQAERVMGGGLWSYSLIKGAR